MSDMSLQQALRGRLINPASVRQFVEAGNATLTLVSLKTGERFTYKFARPDQEPGKERCIWVRLLSGPDNEGDFTYIGSLWPTDFAIVRRSRRSKVGYEAPSWKALNWFLKQIYNPRGDSSGLSQVEVWHEGRCGRCGRKLTVPQSIASGFGPDCAGRL